MVLDNTECAVILSMRHLQKTFCFLISSYVVVACCPMVLLRLKDGFGVLPYSDACDAYQMFDKMPTPNENLVLNNAMWRPIEMAKLVRQLSRLGTIRAQTVLYSHNSLVQNLTPIGRTITTKVVNQFSGETISWRPIGENVSRNDKVNFLVKILMDLDNSKESVYSALDAWVAWETNFPIGSLRRALVDLEKQHQWHRIIHVIKWMLSKGQGTTMGTYGQLVRALDMDHRVEEAHEVWVKKLGVDLHSVPWQLCQLMISVYYRNNMMERVVKLFKGLEAFDRKPRDKKIVKKVGDAYEILGLIEEKERVFEKYKSLFNETSSSKKSAKTSVKKVHLK